MRRTAVYVADAGSVARSNFGWVRADSAAPDATPAEGDSIERMVDGMLHDLRTGLGIALGFECPLFVPVPAEATALGKARSGECTKETGNKPFTGSAGACAAMTGLVELAWALRRVHDELPSCAGTLDWGAFAGGRADVFLWEAFVSGKEKGKSHASDASLGVRAFLASLPDPVAASRVQAVSPLSLVGATLLWAGLTSDPRVLHQPVPVLRPIPDGERRAMPGASFPRGVSHHGSLPG